LVKFYIAFSACNRTGPLLRVNKIKVTEIKKWAVCAEINCHRLCIILIGQKLRHPILNVNTLFVILKINTY